MSAATYVPKFYCMEAISQACITIWIYISDIEVVPAKPPVDQVSALDEIYNIYHGVRTEKMISNLFSYNSDQG